MKTKLSASCIGTLAAQTLRTTDSDIIGEIIAVFPTSFYVKTSNHELLFATTRQLGSPITINIDSKKNLQQIIKPYEKVTSLRNGILIGESTYIDLDHASQHSGRHVTLSERYSIAKEVLYRGALILSIVDSRLSVLDPAGLAYSGVVEFVSDGILGFRRTNNTDAFRDSAVKIVGLGMGFTPSGDDLLGGFLATYNSFTPALNRQTINLDFSDLENRTNWISAKLLDYMQRNVLDDQVRNLIGFAASSKEGNFILALETLLPRGHTSGIDISVGVLLALGLISDLSCKDDSVSSIGKTLNLLR